MMNSTQSRDHQQHLNQTRIDLLENKLVHLDQLTTTSRVNHVELKENIEEIKKIAIEVMINHSRNRSQVEIGDLMNNMQTRLNRTQQVLVARDQTSIYQRVKAFFSLCDVKVDRENERDAHHDQIKRQESEAGEQVIIDEKKMNQSLIRSLADVQEQIKDFQTQSLVIEYFKKETSFPEKLAAFRDRFIQGLFGFILDQISKGIFILYHSRLSFEEEQKKMEMLKAEFGKITKKLAALNKKREKLEAVEPNNIRKKMKLEIEINQILLQQLAIVKKQRDVLQKINNFQKKIELGRQTRLNLHSIGGTNVKLQLQDATLDGMYLSFDSFRKTLQEAGAQMYTLTLDSSIDEPIMLKGLCFSPETSDHAVQQALTSLGAFSEEGKEGAGWSKLILSDGTTLIVTDEESNQLKQLGWRNEKGELILHADKKIEIEKSDWNPPDGEVRGTVLLTSGNTGVYEMHKGEILAFLMRGMNVMTFNFRGYGESEGVSTGEGLKRDMEAAYQYIKTQHHIPDEKIMVKALCMSGGPAAHLAARHPDVNLFIDQSYANFDDIVKDEIDKYVDDFVKKNQLKMDLATALQDWCLINLSSIAHAVSQLAAPAWSVEKEIGKIKGHVAILLTTQDKLVQLDRDVYKNYSAALSNKKAKSVSLFAMEGHHGDSWLRSKDLKALVRLSPKEKVMKELEQNKRDGRSPSIGEAYKISYNPRKANRLIKSLVKDLPKKEKEEVVGDMERLLVDFMNKLPVTDCLSKFDFNHQLTTYLDHLPPDNKIPREKIRALLERGCLKQDRLQRYKYAIRQDANHQLDLFLQQYPCEKPYVVSATFRTKLNTLIEDFNKNYLIEEVLDGLLEDVSEEEKSRVQEFFTSLIIPRDPYQALYDEITDFIDKTQPTAQELDKKINALVDLLPNEHQEKFKQFIGKHIHRSADLLDDSIFRARRYEGRLQMDAYLQKAGLKSSFID